MKRIISSSLVSLIGLLFLVFPALSLAQTSTPTATPRGTGTQLACQIIENKITEQINLWNTNEPLKVQLYQSLVDRAQTVLTNLQNKGYDTTAFKASLDNLNQAILKRHSDASTLIGDLTTAQQYVCGASQGQFKDAVKVARAQFQVVKTDTANIRNIWQTQVRVAILALKSQKISSPTPAGTM